jgi:SAM-dependent methyltransferase
VSADQPLILDPTTMNNDRGLSLPRCADCGSIDVVDRGACRRPTLFDHLPEEEKQLADACLSSRLYQCQDCNLGFRHPAISESTLQRMYAQMPTNRWHYTAETNVAWTIVRKWLERKYSPTTHIRLVDVGAFDGSFLQTLSTNWDRQAIEPSADARGLLHQAGIEPIAEFLSDPAPDHRNAFDVVTMFDVFEHLTSPAQSLRDAFSYLKPGGVLIVSTGNHDHWTWRLLGGDHWYLCTAQHVVFGGRRYFQRQARSLKAGRCQFLSHAHKEFGWRQTIRQSVESLVYGGRRSSNSLSRLCAKAALKTPMWASLRHAESAPYAPAIKDHLLVIIQKERLTQGHS